MSNKPPLVAVVGKLVHDYVVSENKLVHLMGGNGSFASLGVTPFISSPKLLSCIGDDFPAKWLSALEKAGVDINNIHKLSRPHDFMTIMKYQLDGDRENIVEVSKIESLIKNASDSLISDKKLKQYLEDLNLWKEELDNLFQFTFFPDPYDYSEDLISSFQGVLICSAKAILQKEWVDRIRSINQKAIIVMDAPVERVNEREILKAHLSTLRRVNCFLPSEQEVKFLFPTLSLEDAIKSLAELGPEVIVVKRGSKGSLFFQRERGVFLSIPSFPTISIDPTGAGDCFCGGFLGGFILTKDFLSSAICGNAVASFAVSSRGADQLALTLLMHKDELNERISFVKENIKKWNLSL